MARLARAMPTVPCRFQKAYVIEEKMLILPVFTHSVSEDRMGIVVTPRRPVVSYVTLMLDIS